MNILISEKAICNVLRSQRDSLNISQREIAKKLGYRNANYVSMLETGNSRIPVFKIPAIVEAYRLPKSYIAVMIRELYPDHWDFIKVVNSDIMPYLVDVG